MAKPKIRCGVAGVGSLGQHHARIYAALPGAELAGIYETNDARAAEICAKHNCRRFASLDELGAGCDAVSVVVPTDKHAEVALPLLEMYTRGVVFRTGRVNARAAIPHVLDLLATGRLQPERVTSAIVQWDDAPDALANLDAKTVVVR